MKDQAGLKTRQTEKVYLQREYVIRVRKYVIRGTEPEETQEWDRVKGCSRASSRARRLSSLTRPFPERLSAQHPARPHPGTGGAELLSLQDA